MILLIALIFIITLIGVTFLVFYQIEFITKESDALFTEPLSPLDADGLNKELEPFGFAYDQAKDIFYSIMYPWQRNYGYGKPYDVTAPLLSMIIDSEPIYFEYNNRNWLIEFWKGQYGMTTGAEIGVYSSKSNVSVSDIIYEAITDKDLLAMSFILKKKSDVLFKRSEKHWWLTSFKLGEFSKPSDLVMEISIELKDKVMRDAFVKSLNKVGYKAIAVNNNVVSLTFDKPYTKKPITRNKIIDYIMQKYNKHNCNLFNKITKDYNNALDKINYIRSFLPGMYTQLFNFSKTENLFMFYKKDL